MAGSCSLTRKYVHVIFLQNEFDAHRLIEKCDSALTVQKMRQVLKEIDVDFNKMVSLSEFMIYKFGVDWHLLVNAPQGCDMGAINEAQAGLDNANKMLQVAISASEKAKVSDETTRSEATGI